MRGRLYEYDQDQCQCPEAGDWIHRLRATSRQILARLTIYSSLSVKFIRYVAQPFLCDLKYPRMATRKFKLFMWKILRWGAYAVFVSLLVETTWNETVVGDNIIAGLAILLIGVPAGIIVLMALSFMVYHWMKDGNPFIQESPPRLVFRDHLITPKKDTKKFCRICKRNTHCRIEYSKGMRAYIHVQKG